MMGMSGMTTILIKIRHEAQNSIWQPFHRSTAGRNARRQVGRGRAEDGLSPTGKVRLKLLLQLLVKPPGIVLSK